MSSKVILICIWLFIKYFSIFGGVLVNYYIVTLIFLEVEIPAKLSAYYNSTGLKLT